MKRVLPWILLFSFYLLGTALLIEMRNLGQQTRLVHQSSEYAIINLSGEEAQEWFDQGKLKIATPGKNSKTLIRVRSGNPTRVEGKLESDGEILLINPAGIIVGPDASITFPEIRSTLDPPRSSGEQSSTDSPDSVELNSHGNVYALALKKAGKIRATAK